MSRGIKAVLWTAAVFAGLLLLVLIVAPLLLPREQIRTRIVTTLEEALDRPVAVEGFSIRLLPSARLHLRGLHLGSPPDGPRQEISLKSCNLQVSLWPLLRRQVQVRQVEIVAPRIAIELPPAGSGAARSGPADPGAAQDAGSPTGERPAGDGDRESGGAGKTPAGADSLPHPASGDADAAQPGSASAGNAPPLEIRVERLTIRDGAITVYPAGAAEGDRPLLEIGGLTEDLSATALPNGDWSLAGDTEIGALAVHLPAGEFGKGLTLRLRKELRYVAADDLLTIRTATLHLGELPVAATGEIAGLTSDAINARLELHGGPADVAGILAYLPADLFPETRDLRSAGTLELHASLQGPLGGAAPPDFTATLTLDQGRIEHPEWAQPITDLAVTVHVSPDELVLSRAAAALGDGRVTAGATLSGLLLPPDRQRIEASFAADLDLKDLKPWMPPETAIDLQGRVTADLAVRGSLADPANLRPEGSLAWQAVAVRAEALPAPVSNARGRLTISPATLTLDSVAGQIGGSDLQLAGTLENWTTLMDTPGAAGAAGAAGVVGANAVGAGVVRVDLLLTSATLDLDELAPPRDAADPTDTPPGSPGDEAEAGETSSDEAPPSVGVEALAPLARLSGEVRIEIGQLTFARTRAREVRGLVRLDRGRITIERADLLAFGGQVHLDGSIDGSGLGAPSAAPDGRIPFDMNVKVDQVQAAELYSYAAGLNRFARLGDFLSGRISTEARLSGDLREDFSLDPASLSSLGTLETHGAQLVNHPLQNSLAAYLDAPQLSSLAISDWLQPFEIQDGRLSFEKLSFKADQMELKGSGWQALDGSLGMELDLILPKSMSNQALKELPAELRPVLLGDSGEQIQLPMRVSGQFRSPRVALDTRILSARAESLLRQKLTQEQQRLADQLGDQLGREAGQLLEGLLGTEAADSSRTGAKPEEKLKKGVQGLLKDLFKK